MADQEISLRVPKIPKDSYYEDYVAALLNAGGYYLQRSVHRYKEGVELLELDVVATKFNADSVKNTVIEIKSGGWGVKDIFKVKGWLSYLEIEANGAFIFQDDTPEHDYEIIKELADGLGIDLIQNKTNAEGKLDNDDLKAAFEISLDGVPESVIHAFRYNFAQERVMQSYILEYSKKNPEVTTARQVYDYLRDLNNTSFRYKNPIDRLLFLCNISSANRYIAAKLYHEMKGEGVPDADTAPNFGDDYAKICFPKDQELTPVYVALHASLLNKLYVLESMVEYIVQPQKEEYENKWQRMLANMNYSILNLNVKNGINELKAHQYFHLYPYFWQVFIYVFGGLILLDKKEEEYALLSKITGIPVTEIDNAFSIWDKLFPTQNGWFSYGTDYSKIMILKMMPSPLCGVGVNFRIHLYAPDDMEDAQALFENLKKQVSGYYTYGDLLGWNNVAYTMLKRDTILHVYKGELSDKYSQRLKDVQSVIQSMPEYSSYETFDEVAAQHRGSKPDMDGFVAYYEDGTYDIFAVKGDNNMKSKLNMANIPAKLRLNSGYFRNGYILGTDESTGVDKLDTIWFYSKLDRAQLSDFAEAAELLREKQ